VDVESWMGGNKVWRDWSVRSTAHATNLGLVRGAIVIVRRKIARGEHWETGAIPQSTGQGQSLYGLHVFGTGVASRAKGQGNE